MSRFSREACANGSEGSFGSAKGRPLTPEYLSELEPLNRLLERDEGFGRIVARPTGHGIPIFTLRYPWPCSPIPRLAFRISTFRRHSSPLAT